MSPSCKETYPLKNIYIYQGDCSFLQCNLSQRSGPTETLNSAATIKMNREGEFLETQQFFQQSVHKQQISLVWQKDLATFGKKGKYKMSSFTSSPTPPPQSFLFIGSKKVKGRNTK